MTPHRRRIRGKAVGTLVLEWERAPVGRICRASGQPDTTAGKRRLGQMRAACDTLYEMGRLGVLESVRTGRVHPIRLLDALRTGTLGALPEAEDLMLLAPAVTRWADATAGRFSRQNRRQVARILSAYGGTVSDLPALVKRVQGERAQTPALANMVRDQALAFLRDTLGKAHRLHAALGEVPRLTVAPRYPRKHLTPDALWALLPRLGPAAGAARAMALTGMGPKEYFEDGWEIVGAGVAIHGRKAAGRERVVPCLARDLEAPAVSRDVLIWHLDKAGYAPYDLRRSYARWLSDCGEIPEWRQRVYLGHSAESQTAHYQRGDMAAYLVGDGAALRRYLGLPSDPQRMEVTA